MRDPLAYKRVNGPEVLYQAPSVDFALSTPSLSRTSLFRSLPTLAFPSLCSSRSSPFLLRSSLLPSLWYIHQFLAHKSPLTHPSDPQPSEVKRDDAGVDAEAATTSLTTYFTTETFTASQIKQSMMTRMC